MNLQEIFKNFPYPEYREYQKECLMYCNKAFESGKRIILLELPTGGGKSGIAMALASSVEKTMMLTSLKILQDQYEKDFPNIRVLKGRSNYLCMNSEGTIKPGELTCAAGICKSHGLSKYDDCVYSGKCPYHEQINKTENAQIALLNFSAFLYQTTCADRFLGRKDLMIIDEGHNVESQLLSFLEFNMSDELLDIDFPKLETPEEYVGWFEANNMQEILEDKLIKSVSTDEEEYWQKQIYKFKKLKDKVFFKEHISEYKEDISKKKKAMTVSIKPLFVNDDVDHYLTKYAQKVIIMSATLLNKKLMCKTLGFNEEEVTYVKAPSSFPVKNRPIYKNYAGNMNLNNRDETIPIMAEKITEIMDKYEDKKGIIHTHSFYIQNELLKLIPTYRILNQQNFETKEEMLEVHKNSDNTILMAPALYEGLDLKDELSRFQIICKVPYPYLGDKQLAARAKLDWGYYTWLTSLKIVQAYGRSVRSKEDWADTFILDSQFEVFLKRSQKYLPVWFLDAIK